MPSFNQLSPELLNETTVNPSTRKAMEEAIEQDQLDHPELYGPQAQNAGPDAVTIALYALAAFLFFR